MRASNVRAALCLALFPAGAWAQAGILNEDIYLGLGAAPIQAQTVPGSPLTLSSSAAPIELIGYGYQFLRLRSCSLWAELPLPVIEPHQRTSILPGSVSMETAAVLLGVRFMVPVETRVSLYGAADGGVGFFNYPVVQPGPPAQAALDSVVHGIFAFGGGVDFRLSRRFSFRLELRDLVTGRGLSGVAGPNHLVPTAGLTYHF